MRRLSKYVIYVAYVLLSPLIDWMASMPCGGGKIKRIILASVNGISSPSTAGDASILEFYDLFLQESSAEVNLNKSVRQIIKKDLDDDACVITRDLITFVLIDIINLFRRKRLKIIYYATDVFSNRIQPSNNKYVENLKRIQISLLEKTVWKRADYIFANRHDEYSTIKGLNCNISLVPAKSRGWNERNFRVPNSESNLVFIFVGASGNVPNRLSIATFLRDFWPEVITRYPNSILKIIGGGWEKYIDPISSVELTGFINQAELLNEYAGAHFSIGYLDYGAGVKGKVLEAMENSTIVLGNEVGFEGIDCKALRPFKTADQLLDQISEFSAPEIYSFALKDYKEYLQKNYDEQLIRDGIKSFLTREIRKAG